MNRVLPIHQLDVPHGCITPNSLRSLASAIDRLHAFHTSRGGPSIEEPCLKSVSVEGSEVFARVIAGAVVFKLQLICGSWEFR